MEITREGRTFKVVDDPETRKWRFWEDQFAAGIWEPDTLGAIRDILTSRSGGRYVDVGAWVGPTVLWAAEYAAEVIAVEPDPWAATVLRHNLRLNPQYWFWDVFVVEAAVTADARTRPTRDLRRQDAWGNSTSTLLENRGDGDHVLVDAVSLAEVVEIGSAGYPVDLIKIDVEGGEAEIFPQAAEMLHGLGCPVLLALHLPWIPEPDHGPLLEAISSFTVEEIGTWPDGFQNLLLTP